MYNGQWYGLSIDSIEAVAAEGLATVVNMELEVSNEYLSLHDGNRILQERNL